VRSGGDAEERAAAFIADNVSKPVVGYVAGFTAPEGKTMGHAGAIVSGSAGTAQAKKEALEAAGVKVGKTPSETARLHMSGQVLERGVPQLVKRPALLMRVEGRGCLLEQVADPADPIHIPALPGEATRIGTLDGSAQRRPPLSTLGHRRTLRTRHRQASNDPATHPRRHHLAGHISTPAEG
jgi:hypothetical protein